MSSKPARNSYDEFIEARIAETINQVFLDPFSNKITRVLDAKADSLIEINKLKALRNNKDKASILAAASEYAAANPSDPFAFQKASSHMTNGICDLSDYGATINSKLVEIQVEDGSIARIPIRTVSNIHCA